MITKPFKNCERNDYSQSKKNNLDLNYNQAHNFEFDYWLATEDQTPLREPELRLRASGFEGSGEGAFGEVGLHCP